MKNSKYSFMILTLILALEAQAENQQGNQWGNQQRGQNGQQAGCNFDLTREQQVKSKRMLDCSHHILAATLNGGKPGNTLSVVTSSDNRFSCRSFGGQTLDFKSCEAAIGSYNIVIMAEQAFSMQQGVRKQISNSKRNADVQNSINANGDVTETSAKVYSDSAKEDAGLYAEQMAAFSAAALELAGRAKVFVKNSDSYIKKICEKPASNKDSAYNKTLEELKLKDNPEAGCVKALTNYRNNAAIFGNQHVISQLTAVALEYANKAGQAYIGHKDAKNRAQVVDKVIEELQNPDSDYMVDPCMHDPQSCIGRGTITPGSGSFAGNNFGSGSGSNQSFDFGAGTDSETYNQDAVNKAESFASGDNPYKHEADEASGILNPAAKANVTAASGTGGGGGAGGGGGGGGSASLGDDLQGANDGGDEDSDIKSNKYTPTYSSSGGGAGFESVAGSKDDAANPFASLFDNKDGAGGGIEEDRSIASGDIDGKASGLFQKISNRYELVQKSNRLMSEQPE